MRRTKKGGGNRPSGQDFKDKASRYLIDLQIKQAKAKAKDLLKKANTDVRTVRHEVASLKKSGLVAKRVDVRRYIPTKYMLKKIERNRDVLRGDVFAVKAPKQVREKYTHKGIFEERGSTLIVPREYANQKTKIARGLVEISRSLRMGEEIRLVLPFKAADMEGVANKLLADPTLNGMKKPDELFGFRLFGHNMATFGFPNVEEFADYILTHYQHLFSGKAGKQGVKHFEVFRFKSRNSQLRESPEEGRKYTPRQKHERPSRNHDFLVNRRLMRDAARKARAREKETAEQREARLKYQRTYAARKKQRDWEDK